MSENYTQTVAAVSTPHGRGGVAGNDCGHIDKRYLKACPECQSKNVDYLTRVIGYMKRVSNFSQSRQVEAAKRYYGHA